MTDIVQIIIKYHRALLNGIAVTAQLSAIVWTGGLIVGGLVGVVAAKWPQSVGTLTRGLSFFLSGIPALVLLFWLHYPAQQLLSVVIDPFYTSAAALTLINIFAVADVVRDTLLKFPGELVTAGRVCGLSSSDIVRHIQLPLVLRQIVPTLLMVQVTMLQATLFASLISVPEIFRVAQEINAVEYKPVAVYTALAGFFLLVCLSINGVALILHRRFRRNLSER